MSLNEVTDTFVIHKDVLKDFFRKNSKVPDRRIDPTANECDYLLILSELVTQDQQGAMYRKLRDEFCKGDKQVAITCDVSFD